MAGSGSSRNTPTVRLAQAVGIDKVIERAKMLGLEPDFPQVLSVSLGAVGVSPLNLTQAYTAFANGGIASARVSSPPSRIPGDASSTVRK